MLNIVESATIDARLISRVDTHTHMHDSARSRRAVILDRSVREFFIERSAGNERIMDPAVEVRRASPLCHVAERWADFALSPLPPLLAEKFDSGRAEKLRRMAFCERTMSFVRNSPRKEKRKQYVVHQLVSKQDHPAPSFFFSPFVG